MRDRSDPECLAPSLTGQAPARRLSMVGPRRVRGLIQGVSNRPRLLSWLSLLFSILVIVRCLSLSQFSVSVPTNAFHHHHVAVACDQGALRQANSSTGTSGPVIDSSPLFHRAIRAFGFLIRDPILMGKLFTILSGVAVLLAFGCFLAVHRCPWPEWFVLVLLGSGPGFVYRLSLTRPDLLGLLMLVGLLHAMISGRAIWIVLVGVLWPLSRDSWLFPLVVMALVVLVLRAFERKVKLRGLLILMASVCVGVVIHPDFTVFLKRWVQLYLWPLWLQGIGLAPITLEGGSNSLRVGELAAELPGAFLFTSVALAFSFFSRTERSDDTLALFTVACLMGLLALESRRFVCELSLCSLAFVAFVTRDLLVGTQNPFRDREESGRPERTRSRVRVALFFLSMLVLWFVARSTVQAIRRIRAESGPRLGRVIEELSKRAPKGTTVFVGGWAFYGGLFTGRGGLDRLVVGLDPLFVSDLSPWAAVLAGSPWPDALDAGFLFDPDPSRWLLWSAVCEGDAEEMYSPIALELGARYAVLGRDASTRIEESRDDRFRSLAKGPDWQLWELSEKSPGRLTGFVVRSPIPASDLASKGESILTTISTCFFTGHPLDGRWVRPSQERPATFVDLDRTFFDGRSLQVHMRRWKQSRESRRTVPYIPPEIPAIATYAATVVECQRTAEVELRFGCVQSGTVWIGGRKVVEVKAEQHLRIDAGQCKVVLDKGRNLVVVKCDSRIAAWGFCLGLSGADGLWQERPLSP